MTQTEVIEELNAVWYLMCSLRDTMRLLGENHGELAVGDVGETMRLLSYTVGKLDRDLAAAIDRLDGGSRYEAPDQGRVTDKPLGAILGAWDGLLSGRRESPVA
ncbi:hypothetical protein [Rhodospirillum sp. A1_3_36]|uniref:hypothetical protein n=1 Tax=Rhodospirillum sp. A1_3_36 TaxID=3391666 RepID=UPI0039A4AB88